MIDGANSIWYDDYVHAMNIILIHNQNRHVKKQGHSVSEIEFGLN